MSAAAKLVGREYESKKAKADKCPTEPEADNSSTTPSFHLTMLCDPMISTPACKAMTTAMPMVISHFKGDTQPKNLFRSSLSTCGRSGGRADSSSSSGSRAEDGAMRENSPALPRVCGAGPAGRASPISGADNSRSSSTLLRSFSYARELSLWCSLFFSSVRSEWISSGVACEQPSRSEATMCEACLRVCREHGAFKSLSVKLLCDTPEGRRPEVLLSSSESERGECIPKVSPRVRLGGVRAPPGLQRPEGVCDRE
mmetsp:Transcript_54521/g.165726  ORF Transcript_54521/g.165726 Transcript_54521/m.165726 type:complete len:256 (-) Transcript_54521:181-948(-)